MIKRIVNYFNKTESYSIGRFILEMYLLVIFLKILIILLSLLGTLIYEPIELLFFGEAEEGSSQLSSVNWFEGLLVFCIILPFFESIVGQAIPIGLMSLITNNRVVYLVFSSTWFSLLHSIIFEAIAAGLIIFAAGIIYAWCYVLYRIKGFWKAVFITSVVHGLFNLTTFITFYFL